MVHLHLFMTNNIATNHYKLVPSYYIALYETTSPSYHLDVGWKLWKLTKRMDGMIGEKSEVTKSSRYFSF